jgi:hypothetical protein
MGLGGGVVEAEGVGVEGDGLSGGNMGKGRVFLGLGGIMGGL